MFQFIFTWVVAEEEVVRKDLAAFGIRHSLAVAAGRTQAWAVRAFHSQAEDACHILEVAATSHTHHKHMTEVATQAGPTFEVACRNQCKSLVEAITSAVLRAFDWELGLEAFQVKAMLEELQLKWI